MIANPRMNRRGFAGAAIAVGGAAALALTGCGSSLVSGGGSASPSGNPQADIDAALAKDATLTFWAWGPQYKDVVAAFEKAYPSVKVNLVNNGSNNAEYIKLQNVVKAGSGIPDVAQIEYTALPQFEFGKSLLDLSKYGVSSMAAKYSPTIWSQVNINGGIYGLPQDGGPVAMFYRKDVFDKYGLTVPTTWDEYFAAAQKLHAADPSKFIASDAGDPSFTEASIWQAGGKPFTVSGTNITVNLADKGSTQWASMWSKLLEGGLIDTKTAAWSPDWNAGLGNGKYATWLSGAWAAGTLQNRIPQASGNWRVAQLPQYAVGDNAAGVQGGSSSAVMQASTNKLAAIGFVQWISTNQGANQIWVDEAGFPAASQTLSSDAWVNKPVPYFGNQNINKVFADTLKGVPSGWQFLPYEIYADSVFNDTAGQAWANKSAIAPGLIAWQKVIVSYGNQQGFTVK